MNNQAFNHSTRSGRLASALGLSTCLGLALAATVCTTSLPVQAALPDVSKDYTVQTVEPPEGTTALSFFYINESGMVVIMYSPQGSVGCGDTAIIERGVWKRLLAPMPDGTPAAYTSPAGPNASGEFDVCYNDLEHALQGECICHHAIYKDGKWKIMGGYPTYDGWNWCITGTMNDSGVMPCYAWNLEEVLAGNVVYHGLLVNKSLSLFQLFDAPGACYTWSGAINNAGKIVGQYCEAGATPWYNGTWHGFVSDQGKTFVNVDVPGVPNGTMPLAINNKGDICGVWQGNGWSGTWYYAGTEGFLLRNGTLSAFNVLGASWTFLDSITDSGKLAGVYGGADGNPHGFIATPKRGGK